MADLWTKLRHLTRVNPTPPPTATSLLAQPASVWTASVPCAVYEGETYYGIVQASPDAFGGWTEAPVRKARP